MADISKIKLPDNVTYDIVDNQPAVKNIPNTPCNIATFSGAAALPMPSLKVGIEAQQDLHGYDNPWAGGAGKNLFDKPNLTMNKAIPSGTTIYGQIFGVTTTFKLYGYDEENNEYEVLPLSSNKNSTTTTRAYVRLEISQSALRALGDGNLMVSLSDFTRFEPYSNICPIEGHTEANVYKTGYNIWDEDWEVGAIGYADGQNVPTTDRIRSKHYIPVLPNTSFYYIFPNGGAYFFFDEKKTFISATQTASSRAVITPSNAHFTRFVQYPEYGVVYKNDISINYPSTDTSYHAYNGQTYNIPFQDAQGNPIDVYGGELDVVNGIVTPYPYYASYNGEQLTGEWISDRDVYSPNTSPTIGAQVVNIGATDTPFNVQPTSIKSLLGNNNVWADTGEIEEGSYVISKYSGMTATVANYASSATTASKLGSTDVGSATQPIYLDGGSATACTYTLGKSVPSDAVFTDTKNTTGSTDTSSKIFLIGATSQAANSQTYSDNEVYATSGVLTTKSVQVGGGSATLQYNTTTESIDFIFN